MNSVLPPPKRVEILPTIAVDSREQTPLVFNRLPSISASLTSGDYAIVGCEDLFAIERKTVSDFISCCVGDNRERFERELHRLRGFRFKRLLLVGDREDIEQHRYRSNLLPKAALGTLATFEVRYDIPVVWAATPDEAAQLIESWAHYFTREILKIASHFRSSQNQ